MMDQLQLDKLKLIIDTEDFTQDNIVWLANLCRQYINSGFTYCQNCPEGIRECVKELMYKFLY